MSSNGEKRMWNETATFYVATDGNDSWSGRLPTPRADRTDGPFATLVRARDAVRKLKATVGLKAPLTVMVRGGKYFLEHTLVLNEEDSGTRECPITCTAYPGEAPILSGGRRLTGWKPYKGKVLQCDAPGTKGGKWKFRQLFLNGERQIRARYPNFDPDNPLYGGWAHIEGPAEEGSAVALKYKPGTFPRRWARPAEGEVYIWPYLEWGDTCIIPIRSINERTRIITLAHRTKNFDVPPWFYPTHFKPGNRFRVENLLEELDQPGEWCLDSEDGVLYFWPPCDNVEDAEVVAPRLGRLLDLRAAWVMLSGFTFTETTYAGDNFHPADVDGTGAMAAETGWKYCDEAIHLERAEHCIIERNRIRAVGGNGIYLKYYNGRNAICHNEISFAGACGVSLAGGRVLKLQEKPEHPLCNKVTDNEIHRCGFFNKYAAGVFLGRSEANVIAHNDIHDLPHHAINLGNDGYGRNIIEYNRIQRAALETHDTGAINCWMEAERDGERSGHVIRCNYVADTGRPGGSAFGIYLDNETSNCFVYGNILVRNEAAGIMMKGKNNVIENNIIIGGRVQLRIAANWFLDHFLLSHRFCRNILVATDTHEDAAFYFNYLTRDSLRALAQCDENLFFNSTGKEARIRIVWGSNARQGADADRTRENVSLDEWQYRTGFDAHSLVGDPLFVDPERDDYRLKPESPALKLGFQAIDMTAIGIRKKCRAQNAE